MPPGANREALVMVACTLDHSEDCTDQLLWGEGEDEDVGEGEVAP